MSAVPTQAGRAGRERDQRAIRRIDRDVRGDEGQGQGDIPMPTVGVAVAVIDTDRVLLIKREDFEVWGLPGGGVEAGESLAEAAAREVREETGLGVHLMRVVGVYSRPAWERGGDHVVLFAAVPTDGVLLRDTDGEALDARYFDRHNLPETLIWWHRQRVLDALDGVCGVAWSQHTVWPFAADMSAAAVRDERDHSGLSRQQFYARHFDPASGVQRLDVGEIPGGGS